ncbi:MAG: DUF4870 domain-containing protein [Puniceicoccaceae bacterium]|nr:DUF4870 domain-containing protein [Puniceicoccaceae bacterium]MBL6913335.1 DUF4870 domain-containing protein [Puniceicoccaceae bacterium]
MRTGHNEFENKTPLESTIQTEAALEASPNSEQGDKTMAMLCHLLSFIGFIGIPVGNILGPLVLWLIKKSEDPFVDATGKEVLNFQISATIYGIVCGLLFFVFIGVVLLPVLIIAVVVYTIIGAIKAYEGRVYHYPFTIRFIK